MSSARRVADAWRGVIPTVVALFQGVHQSKKGIFQDMEDKTAKAV